MISSKRSGRILGYCICRHDIRTAKFALALCAALIPLTFAFGQTSPDTRFDEHIAEIIALEKGITNPPRDNCAPLADNEIVVCAHKEDPTRYRVPSTRDEDRNSGTALNTGELHAPNVYGAPPCLAFCVTSHSATTRLPIYYIDLNKIPEPPEGSDGDKIAKGEIRAP